MKSFVIATALALVLGGGAYWVLDTRFQQTADVAFATTGVRL